MVKALEVLEVPEVMRCVLLCTLEAVEGGLTEVRRRYRRYEGGVGGTKEVWRYEGGVGGAKEVWRYEGV